MKKLDKEKFMQTELGKGMEECVRAWDKALNVHYENDWGTDEYVRANQKSTWCQAQWEVYQMAIKQFYGIEYHYTRTDDYFGICTEDETDWLLKVER